MTKIELLPPAPAAPVKGAAVWPLSRLVWPLIGIGAVALSLWLLIRELHGLSLAEVEQSISAISGRRWAIATLSTLLAYVALAWYDRIALLHLGFRLPWSFISAVSFTTYALSHNIGMSMFSGAMVRYRAYSTKGLTITEVGVLVAFCSFTFALGTVLLGSLVFMVDPAILAKLFGLPASTVRIAGGVLLAFVALYMAGSAMHLPPLRIGSFTLVYPRPLIALRQLVAGPLELIGAAGIIYCALPVEHNPGFLIVLGVFLASFSAALLSHAPGGLGVLELVFVTALPDLPKADVLAALLVFRLLYLLLPLALGDRRGDPVRALPPGQERAGRAGTLTPRSRASPQPRAAGRSSQATSRRDTSAISEGFRAKHRRTKGSAPRPKADPGATPIPASSTRRNARLRVSLQPSIAPNR